MAITSNIYGSHNLENFSFSGNIGSLYAVANFVPNSPNLAQFRLYRSIDDYIPYENTNAIFTSNFVDRIMNRLTINDFYGFKFFIDNNPNASSENPYMDITYYGDVLPTEPMPNPTPQPEPQPTPTPVDNNINTGMGNAYYEQDLTTNVKKYFAEAFKFDGSQFEMDGDRIVGLKQSFIDSLATDLTNIVNTSIRTATLEADIATINQTLTALGINTDLLKTKDLRLVDAQGHEHKLHLGN